MRHGRPGGWFAGAVAGAAAVYALDRLDWYLYRKQGAAKRAETEAARPGGRDPAHEIAHRAAQAVGVSVGDPKQNAAGLAIHYGIGMLPGAVYGGLVRHVPALGWGRGLLYGLGLWVVEDELANPALGLAAPPGRYPWQDHARGFVAHVAYGIVLDAVVRVLGSRR